MFILNTQWRNNHPRSHYIAGWREGLREPPNGDIFKAIHKHFVQITSYQLKVLLLIVKQKPVLKELVRYQKVKNFNECMYILPCILEIFTCSNSLDITILQIKNDWKVQSVGRYDILFRIFPVTLSSAEHPFSKLKLINTYLRETPIVLQLQF